MLEKREPGRGAPTSLIPFHLGAFAVLGIGWKIENLSARSIIASTKSLGHKVVSYSSHFCSNSAVVRSLTTVNSRDVKIHKK